MKICALTATCGRHSCLERVVRFFIEQSYPDKIQLIYNNAPSYLRLNSHIEGSNIILINNHLDLQTGKKYENVGAIFRDALTFIPKDIDIVTHFDDDDIYLPNHLEEGVNGIKRAIERGKVAYKPYFSYFREKRKVSKVHNTMEPSVFVKLDYLKRVGYRQTVVDYNQGWLDPLIENDEILIDKEGISTFIYDWSGETGAFKISGAANSRENFDNHKKNSVDHGDGIITPISKQKAEFFYKIN